jgi:hypothetical protein
MKRVNKKKEKTNIKGNKNKTIVFNLQDKNKLTRTSW